MDLENTIDVALVITIISLESRLNGHNLKQIDDYTFTGITEWQTLSSNIPTTVFKKKKFQMLDEKITLVMLVRQLDEIKGDPGC